ncbi:M15 family metallopeptidase [Streptomyces tsukubensis]|uniref:D-alanyl-D-alanine dipeptidase n=1 Tax=Streptomyces tsukubensis TaxID=83656 RepID=A0A1V3ZZM0_9ACTN|nr:M15 family metallopeptidase [Streptomyces tsukubensis]OON71614.1 D-alanyl-D-alanine dipeptidase [Streptomyces tsukubensis]QFR92480.1 D-alanyl-D-alanine dipeptidase [Streptomyces tsukubensis]
MTRLSSVLRGLPIAAAALLTLTAASSTVSAAPSALTAPGTASASSTPSAREPRAPEEFVALHDVAPTIIEEMRYFTPHDFMGVSVDGYREPRCLVTRPTALALRSAQRSLRRQGYALKVYDCYRPQRAVDHFVRWAKDLDDQRMKPEFYPRVDKTRLFDDGYIAEKSGHSRGSTVDLTLVELPARPTRPYVPGEPLAPCYGPQKHRFPDNSIDMGTGFDCFDTLAHTDDPRITGIRRTNRDLLRDALTAVGFTNLPEEWWHFTHTPELFPDTYFDFPVARRSLTRP